MMSHKLMLSIFAVSSLFTGAVRASESQSIEELQRQANIKRMKMIMASLGRGFTLGLGAGLAQGAAEKGFENHALLKKLTSAAITVGASQSDTVINPEVNRNIFVEKHFMSGSRHMMYFPLSAPALLEQSLATVTRTAGECLGRSFFADKNETKQDALKHCAYSLLKNAIVDVISASYVAEKNLPINKKSN